MQAGGLTCACARAGWCRANDVAAREVQQKMTLVDLHLADLLVCRYQHLYNQQMTAPAHNQMPKLPIPASSQIMTVDVRLVEQPLQLGRLTCLMFAPSLHQRCKKLFRVLLIRKHREWCVCCVAFLWNPRNDVHINILPWLSGLYSE